MKSSFQHSFAWSGENRAHLPNHLLIICLRTLNLWLRDRARIKSHLQWAESFGIFLSRKWGFGGLVKVIAYLWDSEKIANAKIKIIEICIRCGVVVWTNFAFLTEGREETMRKNVLLEFDWTVIWTGKDPIVRDTNHCGGRATSFWWRIFSHLCS